MIHAFSGHIFRRIDAAIIAQMVLLRRRFFQVLRSSGGRCHDCTPTICAVMTASAAI
jgi:hypothetical protein